MYSPPEEDGDWLDEAGSRNEEYEEHNQDRQSPPALFLFIISRVTKKHPVFVVPITLTLTIPAPTHKVRGQAIVSRDSPLTDSDHS